jgi:transcriptional regulator with GAF, ATPase, and Fis domain
MSEFARFAQDLSALPDETARLQLAVDLAVKLVDHCDYASIAITEKRGVFTRVSSDDLMQRANELQHELNEGPCLDVGRDQDTVISPDLTRERRWPTWTARVQDELGVGSMMSLLIYTDEHSYGTLSLYGSSDNTFDSDDVATGHTIAAHLAVVMTAERNIDQLGLALLSRIVIGRAEGILMERLNISEDQAFDFLRRVSSQTNRKLVEVAEEIARTRVLPHLA